jgi:hypothetical protein
MDWSLAGILTGIVVCTSAAAYGVVGVITSDTASSRIVVAPAAVLVPAAALPVIVSPSIPREELGAKMALASLPDSSTTFEFERPRPLLPPIERAVRKLGPTPATPAKLPPGSGRSGLGPAGAAAILEQAQPGVSAEQWRVLPTSRANYFNLGGHIDRYGTVDNLANGYLRDAFRAHRNFGKLPANLRTHILTENICLPKIAPFRALLGMEDKKIEEEQGIRFERVASTH